MRRGTPLLMSLLVAAAWPAAASASAGGRMARVALVPFESPVGSSARSPVMAAVGTTLAARGLDVVMGDPVEDLLAARRIRYLDSLTGPDVKAIASALQADAVVQGTIVAYEQPPGKDPTVAVKAKLVSSDGQVLWTDLVSMDGGDTENALGLGRTKSLETLVDVVVRRLFESMPTSPVRVRVRHAPGRWSLPRVYRADALARQHPSVCVLPLVDRSESPGAARVVGELLQRRLAERASLDLIEPAEMRRVIVEDGLPPLWQMQPQHLKKLGDALGTRYLLSGVIYAYGTAQTLPNGLTGPVVELYLSLVDVVDGRVMWSGLHRRNGAESDAWLKLGARRDPLPVADRVVTEMIEAFTRY